MSFSFVAFRLEYANWNWPRQHRTDLRSGASGGRHSSPLNLLVLDQFNHRLAHGFADSRRGPSAKAGEASIVIAAAAAMGKKDRIRRRNFMGSPLGVGVCDSVWRQARRTRKHKLFGGRTFRLYQMATSFAGRDSSFLRLSGVAAGFEQLGSDWRIEPHCTHMFLAVTNNVRRTRSPVLRASSL